MTEEAHELKAKEEYEKPEVKSEEVEIGVYGCYGTNQPISHSAPFFGLCCSP